MGIGTSLLLIAVGAILRYAVTTRVAGIEIETVGLILLIVGIVGLVISILYTTVWSREAARDEPGYRDPARDRW